ncbi:MAG: hypothetical protein MR639_15375 [Clostridium sp.]|uniref:hypothetical protein n=1 Tax=Clostridium sp. TaxID=1506 RepID=UPI002A879B65|nr:hypothetical protein [Clostridium sp.]MDY5098536.1 hypothetical protein [Clostridium sp.]
MNIYDFYITPEEYKISKENNIPARVLEERIRKCAWDKEKALTQPVKIYKKKTNKYIRELARQNNIAYTTVLYRINKLNMTALQASTLKKIDTRKFLKPEQRRKYPKEFLELSEKNGISRRLFYYRVNKRHMSLEEAATTPLINRSKYMTELNKNHVWRRF